MPKQKLTRADKSELNRMMHREFREAERAEKMKRLMIRRARRWNMSEKAQRARRAFEMAPGVSAKAERTLRVAERMADITEVIALRAEAGKGEFAGPDAKLYRKALKRRGQLTDAYYDIAAAQAKREGVVLPIPDRE